MLKDCRSGVGPSSDVAYCSVDVYVLVGYSWVILVKFVNVEGCLWLGRLHIVVWV